MEEHKQQAYEEWAKKIREASGMTETHYYDEKKQETKPDGEKKNYLRKFLISCFLFLLAIIPPLFYIFFVSGTQNAGLGWYNDSYHHWQIGYLTEQIGLGKSFLRLWDLQGMEYFWGLLHPLILALLFFVTNSADIIVPRLFNVFLAGVTAVSLFMLVRKHFNWQSAIASVFLFIFNPVSVYAYSSGMQEPLGILLLILALFFWSDKPIFSGLFFALASVTRAEYWVFSLGLIIVIFLFEKYNDKKALLAVSYFVPVLLYAKYLLDKTGNAIYPIYWNFMGNAAGKWQADIPLTSEQILIRYVLLVILLVSILGALVLVAKRPRMYLFYLLGIGNLIFLTGFIGFTQYLKSYLLRFWVDRIFLLPYIFLGVLLSALVLYYLPKKIKYVGNIIGIATVIMIILLIQFSWFPIDYYAGKDKGALNVDLNTAREIVSFYKGGSILIPGNDPIFTYALYKEGIEGKNIRGQMFDPYFYIIDEDPYLNWKINRKTVLSFFKKEDIKLLVFGPKQKRYEKLVQKEPKIFKKDTTINIKEFTHGWVIDYLEVYSVGDIK